MGGMILYLGQPVQIKKDDNNFYQALGLRDISVIGMNLIGTIDTHRININ